MVSSTLWAVLIFTASFLLYWTRYGRKSTRYRPPPGPPGLPFVGNVFDVPSMPTWVTYKRWSETFGSPVIRLNILGQNYIVVNTYQAMVDLLEKKSAIYSDRCGFSWSIAHARYGREWRVRRKLFHSQFSLQASKRYHDIEEKATHQFLGRLMSTPEQFMSHVRLLAGALIADLAYGFKVKDHDDIYLRTSEQASDCLRATAHAGSFLVDILPSLRYVPEWLPGAGFQRKAKSWASAVRDVPDMAYKQYQKSVVRHHPRMTTTDCKPFFRFTGSHESVSLLPSSKPYKTVAMMKPRSLKKTSKMYSQLFTSLDLTPRSPQSNPSCLPWCCTPTYKQKRRKSSTDSVWTGYRVSMTETVYRTSRLSQERLYDGNPFYLNLSLTQ